MKKNIYFQTGSDHFCAHIYIYTDAYYEGWTKIMVASWKPKNMAAQSHVHGVAAPPPGPLQPGAVLPQAKAASKPLPREKADGKALPYGTPGFQFPGTKPNTEHGKPARQRRTLRRAVQRLETARDSDMSMMFTTISINSGITNANSAAMRMMQARQDEMQQNQEQHHQKLQSWQVQQQQTMQQAQQHYDQQLQGSQVQQQQMQQLQQQQQQQLQGWQVQQQQMQQILQQQQQQLQSMQLKQQQELKAWQTLQEQEQMKQPQTIQHQANAKASSFSFMWCWNMHWSAEICATEISMQVFYVIYYDLLCIVVCSSIAHGQMWRGAYLQCTLHRTIVELYTYIYMCNHVYIIVFTIIYD